MATVAAMAVREANARERIRLAAGRLGKRIDIDASVETPFIRDANLRKIAELEAHADFLEAADDAIKAKGFSMDGMTPAGALAWVTGEIASRPADTEVQDRHDLVEGVNALGALLGLEVREPMDLSPEELAKHQAQLKEAEAAAKKAKGK